MLLSSLSAFSETPETCQLKIPKSLNEEAREVLTHKGYLFTDKNPEFILKSYFKTEGSNQELLNPDSSLAVGLKKVKFVITDNIDGTDVASTAIKSSQKSAAKKIPSCSKLIDSYYFD